MLLVAILLIAEEVLACSSESKMLVVVPNDDGDAANWAERCMAVPSFLWWFHSELRVNAPTSNLFLKSICLLRPVVKSCFLSNAVPEAR